MEAIATLLPGVVLVDPVVCFASSAEWLRAWPSLVRRLAGLVTFGDADGTIGAGCLREVADAVAFGVPVAAFAPARGLCGLVGVELVGEPSAARCGFLSIGERIDPAAWLSRAVSS
jgi:hypothetical protein